MAEISTLGDIVARFDGASEIVLTVQEWQAIKPELEAMRQANIDACLVPPDLWEAMGRPPDLTPEALAEKFPEIPEVPEPGCLLFGMPLVVK